MSKRKPRFQIRDNVSYHHLMSRTVNGDPFFGDREREVLRKMIWQVAEFSGVRVVTYAVMKNHFHVLAEVPEQERHVSDRELVRRYKVLYPRSTPWQPMRAKVLARLLRENTEEGQYLRWALTRRMHDISWFMKTVKQRFSRWYNGSRDRFGPVWSERFKNVLVEGDAWALKTVAAYIDLNAVRAGLVSDPKDYRFCGYAEALGGGAQAREGLRVVDRDLSGYRQTLYGSGSSAKDGKEMIAREEALQVLRSRGKLPLSVALRCKIRYFSDGMVLGSPDFVESQLAHDHKQRQRPGRVHSMQGSDWKGLAVGVGLRKDLFR